jgi:hypothetical protein
MENVTVLILVVILGFNICCLIFLPVFILQIRNAAQKTNRLLQELVDQGRPEKKRTRQSITGMIGDQGIDR